MPSTNFRLGGYVNFMQYNTHCMSFRNQTVEGHCYCIPSLNLLAGPHLVSTVRVVYLLDYYCIISHLSKMTSETGQMSVRPYIRPSNPVRPCGVNILKP